MVTQEARAELQRALAKALDALRVGGVLDISITVRVRDQQLLQALPGPNHRDQEDGLVVLSRQHSRQTGGRAEQVYLLCYLE